MYESESILLVDDEEHVRHALGMALQLHGYRLQLAGDSHEALRHLQSDQTFDLMITDETMPELSGCELARRAHALRPELPIILCSGFVHRKTEERAKQAGVLTVLHKPVELAELIQQIRNLLDR